MFNSFPQPKPDVGGGSNIKSIQTGLVSIPNGSTSATSLISAVDLTKSIVIVSLKYSIDDNINNNFCKVELTNPTTVTFTRSGTTQTPQIYFTVIEFNNVKSLQSGTSTYTNAFSMPVSVSAINPAKSLLFFTYSITYAGLLSNPYQIQGYISGPTQIYFNSANSVSTQTASIAWRLIEFL